MGIKLYIIHLWLNNPCFRLPIIIYIFFAHQLSKYPCSRQRPRPRFSGGPGSLGPARTRSQLPPKTHQAALLLLRCLVQTQCWALWILCPRTPCIYSQLMLWTILSRHWALQLWSHPQVSQLHNTVSVVLTKNVKKMFLCCVCWTMWKNTQLRKQPEIVNSGFSVLTARM